MLEQRYPSPSPYGLPPSGCTASLLDRVTGIPTPYRLKAGLHTLRLLVLLGLLWAFTGTLLAADATAQYRTPHPFAKTWARSIGFSFVGAAALLISYTL